MTNKQRKKTKQIILYLLSKCGGKMSKKRLIYMLYFIDFNFFEKYQEKICGLTYIKGRKELIIKEL